MFGINIFMITAHDSVFYILCQQGGKKFQEMAKGGNYSLNPFLLRPCPSCSFLDNFKRNNFEIKKEHFYGVLKPAIFTCNVLLKL